MSYIPGHSVPSWFFKTFQAIRRSWMIGNTLADKCPPDYSSSSLWLLCASRAPPRPHGLSTPFWPFGVPTLLLLGQCLTSSSPPFIFSIPPLGLSRLGGHQVPSSQEGTERSRIRQVACKVPTVQEASNGHEGARDSVPGYQATRRATSVRESAKGAHHRRGRQVA